MDDEADENDWARARGDGDGGDRARARRLRRSFSSSEEVERGRGRFALVGVVPASDCDAQSMTGIGGSSCAGGRDRDVGEVYSVGPWGARWSTFCLHCSIDIAWSSRGRAESASSLMGYTGSPNSLVEPAAIDSKSPLAVPSVNVS